MTNEELVDLIQKGVDKKKNLQLLYEQNKGYFYVLANKYSTLIEEDDLMQECFLALCEAVEHFDPTKESKFFTYAVYWIKLFVFRYIKRNSTGLKAPYYVTENILKYNRIVSEYQKEYGTEPLDEEICKRMEINQKQLEKIKLDATKLYTTSLDSALKEDSKETFVNFVPSENNDIDDVIDRIAQKELEELLWGLVSSLPGESSEFIYDKFKKNMTHQEIADKKGITTDNVVTSTNKALKELRQPKNLEKLKQYYIVNEKKIATAMHGTYSNFSRTWTSSTERAAFIGVQ